MHACIMCDIDIQVCTYIYIYVCTDIERSFVVKLVWLFVKEFGPWLEYEQCAEGGFWIPIFRPECRVCSFRTPWFGIESRSVNEGSFVVCWRFQHPGFNISGGSILKSLVWSFCNNHLQERRLRFQSTRHVTL